MNDYYGLLFIIAHEIGFIDQQYCLIVYYYMYTCITVMYTEANSERNTLNNV